MSFRKHLLLFVLLANICLAPSYVVAVPPPASSTYAMDPSPSAETESKENSEKEMTPEEMTTSYESAFAKMIFVLLGFVLFVGLGVWILRRVGKLRFKGMGASRSIQILEKKALSPKSMLYLIEVDNKRVLISESQFEVRQLVTLDSNSDSEDPT